MMATLTTTGHASPPNVAPPQVPLQLFSGQFIQLAIIFFVLAIATIFVGARGVAGVSMETTKWLVVIFIVLAIVSLVL